MAYSILLIDGAVARIRKTLGDGVSQAVQEVRPVRTRHRSDRWGPWRVLLALEDGEYGSLPLTTIHSNRRAETTSPWQRRTVSVIRNDRNHPPWARQVASLKLRMRLTGDHCVQRERQLFLGLLGSQISTNSAVPCSAFVWHLQPRVPHRRSTEDLAIHVQLSRGSRNSFRSDSREFGHVGGLPKGFDGPCPLA